MSYLNRELSLSWGRKKACLNSKVIHQPQVIINLKILLNIFQLSLSSFHNFSLETTWTMIANDSNASALEIVHHHFSIALWLDAGEVAAIHASLGAFVETTIDLC